ncbi:tetratricopeptide repeat protein 19, mitochondrial-like isoform X2 [Patiria miniata]|nr:tetratricopeptide repeat protein 19, mitochondrial-like isoform X2 [Patiria miniata]
MKGVYQNLSRIFLLKRSLHSSLLVHRNAFKVPSIRPKQLESTRCGNICLRNHSLVLVKTLCTDSTTDNVGFSKAARRTTSSSQKSVTSSDSEILRSDNSGTGIAGPKEQLGQKLKGDINVSHDSLYDLSSDLKTTVESQEEQAQNPDFYRRRAESEFGADGKRRTFKGYHDSNQGPGQFVEEPPIVREKRKPMYEPAYYYGFASILCCSVVVALALFKKEQKDTIELLIAKSWAEDREGNLAKAEALLHKALKMAQDDKNTNAVTYIFDQMANLSMRHGNLTKAEGLFKETLKLMISSGTAQDDSAVIEISLKLARMFDRMRRYDDAEQGFKWCISTTEKKLAQPNDKETTRNLQSLLGMCLDCHARFLAAHGRLQEAKEMYKRALHICEEELKIDGIPHPQTVILLNDLGTVHDLGGDFAEAIELIERASDLAEERSPHDLPTVLCNLASVNMHAEKFEEARSHYKRALSVAERQGDAAAILEIKNSMAQLDTNVFLKKQKEGNKKRELGQKS